MNERIKELADQVGGYGTGALMNPSQIQKFAELIVQDCIQCVKDWREAAEDPSDDLATQDYRNGYLSGCDNSIIEMQIRFGIKNAD